MSGYALRPRLRDFGFPCLYSRYMPQQLKSIEYSNRARCPSVMTRPLCPVFCCLDLCEVPPTSLMEGLCCRGRLGRRRRINRLWILNTNIMHLDECRLPSCTSWWCVHQYESWRSRSHEKRNKTQNCSQTSVLIPFSRASNNHTDTWCPNARAGSFPTPARSSAEDSLTTLPA